MKVPAILVQVHILTPPMMTIACQYVRIWDQLVFCVIEMIETVLLRHVQLSR